MWDSKAKSSTKSRVSDDVNDLGWHTIMPEKVPKDTPIQAIKSLL